MFVYAATDSEREVITRLFGLGVEEVWFYDFDYPDEQESHWEEIVAVRGGLRLRRNAAKVPGDSGYHELEDIAAGRDQTVKFGLRLTPKVAQVA